MVVGDFTIELDMVVIGTGPGGYVAAIRATEMGQKVAIIERECIGGACLNIGCTPSKALIAAGHYYQESLGSEMLGITSENVKLDFAKMQEWRENKVVHTSISGVGFPLKKHKVGTIEGEVFFVDDHIPRIIHPDSAQTHSFNNATVATGSRPTGIPGFKFEGCVLDPTDGLALKEVPKKLMIIGDGVIGAESSGAYVSLGAEVTILKGSPQVLPTYEKDLVKLVEDDFKKKDVAVITNVVAEEAVDNGDSVTVKYAMGGEEEPITAGYVMVAVGRRPNTDDMGLGQTGIGVGERGLIMVDKQGHMNVPNTYAIGGIAPGATLAHKVSCGAKTAVEAISGKEVTMDYKVMPAIAFTDPGLASVGMTIKEAKDAGIGAKAYKFPLSGNGRALSLGKTEGFIRLVTTIEDDMSVGAQIGGVGASDIISELALAIESGMNAEGIVLTIHPYPSLDEAVMDASGLALDLPIHI